MALAQAISKNALSLAVKQTTYKENVVAVNTLVTSVLTSNLPTLNQNPPDWKEFQAAFEAADTGALSWVNNVMARLLDVPEDVKSYNATITQLLADAKSQAQTLEADPSNKTALQTLNTDLTNVTNTLNLVVTFISGALTAIKNFQDELPKLAANLQTIADNSAKDAKADQARPIAAISFCAAHLGDRPQTQRHAVVERDGAAGGNLHTRHVLLAADGLLGLVQPHVDPHGFALQAGPKPRERQILVVRTGWGRTLVEFVEKVRDLARGWVDARPAVDLIPRVP